MLREKFAWFLLVEEVQVGLVVYELAKTHYVPVFYQVLVVYLPVYLS
mgnify:CR=1 FL=1